MATPEFVEVTLYSHWASALVNGDYSGLSDEEVAEIEGFIGDQLAQHELFYCTGVESDESRFGMPDNGGLVGDVLDFTFQIQ